MAAYPVQDSQADKGSRGTCSPAPPCAQRYGTGKTEGCGDVDLSGTVAEDDWIWTDGGLRIYSCDRGRRRRKQRILGDGKRKRKGR